MDILTIVIILVSFSPFIVLQVTKKYLNFAILSVFAVAIHGYYLFGFKIFLLLIITYIVSTFAELLSLKTSISFFGGKYKYNLKHSYFSSHLNLLGVYPIEISLTWVILKYISFCIALLIITAFSLNKLYLVFLTPLILVSLDFIIDPVAVKLAKMWNWEKSSKYFGIPYGNFLGWYIVGLISSLLFSLSDFTAKIKVNILFLLPIILYFVIFKNVTFIYKLDKTKSLIGAFPAVLWILLGLSSFVILLASP
jgi:uncharacterized membrane protein